jgi:hypothetical protein
MRGCEIYQIAYDEASRRPMHPAVSILDNSHGPRDWFEFWPILTFLRTHTLEDDVWYGFLSPRFGEKTGISIEEIGAVVSRNAEADVALFSSHWCQLAYRRNPWLQGDVWHPGLIAASRRFFDTLPRRIDPAGVYTDFSTSVYSNYFMARRAFWEAWQEVAERYVDFLGRSENHADAAAVTRHRSRDDYPMKVFVQERFAAYLLLTGQWKVVHYDYAKLQIPSVRFRGLDPSGKAWLLACEAAKRDLRAHGGMRARIRYKAARTRVDAAASGRSVHRHAVGVLARRLMRRW